MTQAVIQTTVTGMQGRPIATTAPAANQAYTWSGSAWVPTGPFLPLAGGILTGVLRLQYGTPSLIFNDTATSITAGGLWRITNGTGELFLQANTATAGDFSTSAVALQLNPNGSVVSGSNFTVNGVLSVVGNAALNGSANVVGSITGQAGVFIGTSGAFYAAVSGSLNIINWVTGWYSGFQQGVGFLFQSPSGPVATIAGNGDMAIGGTLTQGSDVTNKTNVVVLTEGISLVRQLTPKSFAWQTAPNETHWGFIAQDVQLAMPAAVSQGLDNTLAIDTTAILAAVTMAVKQLDQRCTALETHDGITPSAGELA